MPIVANLDAPEAEITALGAPRRATASSLGLSFFYNFVRHPLFGEISAAFIGWEEQPISSRGRIHKPRLCAERVSRLLSRLGHEACGRCRRGCVSLGRRGWTYFEIVKAANYASGNAGIILYTDIFLPIIGFVLIWWRYRCVANA